MTQGYKHNTQKSYGYKILRHCHSRGEGIYFRWLIIQFNETTVMTIHGLEQFVYQNVYNLYHQIMYIAITKYYWIQIRSLRVKSKHLITF